MADESLQPEPFAGRLPSAEAGRRGLVPDPSQRRALHRLDGLVGDAVAPEPSPAGLWQRLARRRQPVPRRGVYLWGPPGRGKTLLMECAFAAMPGPKIRLHFFEFFQALHRDLHTRFRGRNAPVATLVHERFAGQRLVCFDEFHVHDIADAMLLQAFLEAAVTLPGFLILTSNYHPDGLLEDSRFHERFRPALSLLESRFEITNVDDGIDYRQLGGQGGSAFLHPLSQAVERRLRTLFAANEPTGRAEVVAHTIEVNLRAVPMIAAGERTLWASFDMLCGGARSAEDYLELSSRFDLFIVSGITAEALSHPWTAQRFVWLVDILYDRGTNLVLSAEAPILDLVGRIAGASDVSRLASRLTEMASWPLRAAGRATVA